MSNSIPDQRENVGEASRAPRLTESDRLRRDQKFMEDMNISHRPEVIPSEYPPHLKKTFRNIYYLGSRRYETYGLPISADIREGWEALCKQSTKQRAKQLSDTARRLEMENPSEQGWRLGLEPLVDSRFRLNIKCPDCDGHLWRSELEAELEREGPIAISIRSARKKRVACKCQTPPSSGLSEIFSNKADEYLYINCDLPVGNFIRLPRRKPDRVYGLLRTRSFEERFERLWEPDSNVESHTTMTFGGRFSLEMEAMLRDYPDLPCITSTNTRPSQFLFPFLLFEAKSEDGGSFKKCGIQSAVPLWVMLRKQTSIEELAGSLMEQGGSLVWYVAYRGASWRVSCFCPITKEGRLAYEIIDLWNGRVSSPDGALQLLLIMDYIFEWARDLYRPSMLHSLDVLRDPPCDREASVPKSGDICSSRSAPGDDDRASNRHSSVQPDTVSMPTRSDPESGVREQAGLNQMYNLRTLIVRSVAGYILSCFQDTSNNLKASLDSFNVPARIVTATSRQSKGNADTGNSQRGSA